MLSSGSPFQPRGTDQSKSGQRAESHVSIPLLRALHQHLSASLFNKTCSDIQIRAFGRTYALHRVFLVQSAFFHSLLNGGFHETAQTDFKHDTQGKDDNVLELHFDDPSITRPAFEYCLAALYGAAPRLTLPSWCSPSPQYPLTEHVKSIHVMPRAQQKQSVAEGEVDSMHLGEADVKSSGAKHPATPRFLLSLLATSLYLGAPSVASTAMTLIMSSITPFTMSHYLRFALGYGIIGASDVKARQESGISEMWDWELEGPAWGLAGLAKDERSEVKAGQKTSEMLSNAGLNKSDSPVSPRKAYAFQSSGSAVAERQSSFQSHSPGLSYGTYSDKIGEACSCWLLRWAADVLRLEEEMTTAKVRFTSDSNLSPYGTLPVDNSLTADDYPDELPSTLLPPRPAVWCHPDLGGVPADYVCSTIASDSFWVREEWDRYDMARRVIALRRSYVYAPAGATNMSKELDLTPSGTDQEDRKETARDQDSVSSPTRTRRDSTFSLSQGTMEDDHDETEYDRLFSEGIYYSHMSFNRLSTISSDVCPYTGLTYAPTNVLQSALWSQAELKKVILSKESLRDDSTLETKAHDDDDEDHEQRVMRSNVRESKDSDRDRELGLISSEQDFAKAFSSSRRRGRTSRAHTADGRRPTTLGGVTPTSQSALQSVGNALEGLLSKRYFAVPNDDTLRMGENLSTLVSSVQSSTSRKYADECLTEEAPSGIAAIQDTNTLAINNDSKRITPDGFFGLQNAVESGTTLAKRGVQQQAKESEDSSIDNLSELYESLDVADRLREVKAREWTGFEPMRVGVEFFNVDRLPEKQRLYSRSFFYAGNVWNLYVQTVRKPKGLQLGIYLHRQNCSDTLPSPSLPSRSSGAMQQSVSQSSFLEDGDDLTIFSRQIENTTNNESHHYAAPQTPQRPGASEAQAGGQSTGSVFLHAPAPAIDPFSPHMRISGTPARTTAQSSNATSAMSTRTGAGEDGHGRHHEQSTPSLVSAASAADLSSHDERQLLEVPYLDQRRILRAYFSIHCPSPMGTSLTKFSSRPDNFSLSQSWGWKSSSLLGSVYLQEGHIGSAHSQTSQTFRCVVTMGVV